MTPEFTRVVELAEGYLAREDSSGSKFGFEILARVKRLGLGGRGFVVGFAQARVKVLIVDGMGPGVEPFVTLVSPGKLRGV